MRRTWMTSERRPGPVAPGSLPGPKTGLKSGPTIRRWTLDKRLGGRNLSRSLQVLAAVAVVVVFALTGEQLLRSRSRVIDTAAQQVSRLDMVFAEQTGRAVETVDLLLRNSTDLLPDRARARPGEVTDLLRSRIANVRQVSALGIADASGVVVAASRTDLLGALPPAGMAELVKNRAEAEPRMHIGEPFRDPDNRWVAMMTRRLLAPEGQFAGIAIAYLNLAYFQDFYEAVDLAENGAIQLHHRNGTVLARFPRADKVVGLNYAREPPFADVLAHAQAGTVVMTSPLDGSERILAIRALKNFPLAISVSVGQAEVLASWWQEVWVFIAASVLGGVGLVGMLLHLSRQARDVEMTERLRAMQEVARLASLDSLTGLLNRTTLTERLEQLLTAAQPGQDQVALLFIDLDGFKEINDLQGHKAGDAVLRVVAGRIRRAAPTADVARWGGDEFVIISPTRSPTTQGDPWDMVVLADAVLREISRPIDVDGQTVRVGGTIGLAAYPRDGLTPDGLVSAADAAMYEGKQSGGNMVRVFDPALAHAVAASADLERDLRQALQDEALSVVYQPIVEMPGERCVAFEALVRWMHPTRGNVQPSEFIPVAEHSGLIGRLGRWVLVQACREAVSWPVDMGMAVTVNVSMAQIFSGELLQDVSTALTQSGLSPHLLHLELTESMVGIDHLRVVPVLQTLRNLGVRIALDDFGTGFSSLSRLRNWPIDTVKVDKAFVRAMERDGTAVIRATLLIASEYGLSVIVEGVETVEQWRELAALGVQSFQGYLFSRALRAVEIVPWLVRVAQPSVPRARGFGWSKGEPARVADHAPLLGQ